MPELVPLDDSTFVATAWSLADFAANVEGAYREEYVVVLMDRNGRLTDTIAELPAWNGFKTNREGGGYSDFAPLFPVDGHLAVGPGGPVLGPADRMVFYRYDAAGELVQVVRAPALDVAMSPADIAAERAAMIRPQSSQRVRGIVHRLPAPDMRPAYADLQVDADGFVWVESYRSPRREADEPATWHVFGPRGAWLGAVSTPPRFTVFEIGADYLLGNTAGFAGRRTSPASCLGALGHGQVSTSVEAPTPYSPSILRWPHDATFETLGGPLARP